MNELHTAADELGLSPDEFSELRRAIQYGEISTVTRADIRRDGVDSDEQRLPDIPYEKITSGQR